MNTIGKLTTVLIAFVLVFGGLAFTASPAAAANAVEAQTCTQFHTVKSGQTLFKIGLIYGLKWTTLAEWNNIKDPGLIFTGQVLCVAKSGTGTTPKPGTIPTFKILSVVRDKSVTIETSNFPANDTFVVRMGAFGTRAVNGVKVETIDSGKGGTFKATFNIPAGLQSSNRIAIRLESPTSGFFAYNWFFNNTTGSGTGAGDGSAPGNGYTGFPTFSISAVVRNNTVTIAGKNFPPNTNFNVLMNVMGTRGVNGIKVETINTGSGGSFTDTYSIPADLHGLRQIAIRLESPATGYFAYNWFFNNTTQ